MPEMPAFVSKLNNNPLLLVAGGTVVVVGVVWYASKNATRAPASVPTVDLSGLLGFTHGNFNNWLGDCPPGQHRDSNNTCVVDGAPGPLPIPIPVPNPGPDPAPIPGPEPGPGPIPWWCKFDPTGRLCPIPIPPNPGPTPGCQIGYHWNGTACVPDIPRIPGPPEVAAAVGSSDQGMEVGIHHFTLPTLTGGMGGGSGRALGLGGVGGSTEPGGVPGYTDYRGRVGAGLGRGGGRRSGATEPLPIQQELNWLVAAISMGRND